MLRVALALALINPCSGEDAHAGHDHGGAKEWEWAGTFATPGSSYVWTAQNVKQEDDTYAYADPAMKIVVLPATASNMEALEAAEAEAGHAFETTCVDIAEGGTFAAQEDVCYKLTFNPNKHTSTFTINTASASNVVIFAEHFPTEFERDLHYLHDSACTWPLPEALSACKAVEPDAQEPTPEALQLWRTAHTRSPPLCSVSMPSAPQHSSGQDLPKT